MKSYFNKIFSTCFQSGEFEVGDRVTQVEDTSLVEASYETVSMPLSSFLAIIIC